MSQLRYVLVGLFCAALAACGGSGNADDDDDTAVDAPSVDTAIPDGWTSLMEGDWSLAAGQEGYYCTYATVPRDMYVKAFRPLIPLGTHHTVVTRLDSGGMPDGTYPCNVGTNGQSMVYGSGVGSPDFVFPDRVGLFLPAGTRLLSNLHLYNASDEPLSGRSGVLIQEGTDAEIDHDAEIVLAGPTFTLQVPTGESVQQGNCSISSITNEPITVFALSQHMHKLGHHMRSVITRGSEQITLQDIDYNFENQTFQLKNPTIELRPGDTLTTYCSYNNTTGSPVTFGESSDDEMCFTDLFYYPAQGAEFICTGL
jgi:hypothetical protein